MELPPVVPPVSTTVVTVKPWQSKTLWASLIVALAPMIPGVGPLVAANPEVAAAFVGLIFGALRLTSEGKVGK